jgi:CubicO group peptidase (beta-lactamase class C family)
MDVQALRESPAMRDVLGRLQERLEHVVESQNWTGLAAAVVIDQSLLWCGAFGHASLEEKRPVTVKTLFGVGSITKAFTAIALFQLRDAGLLCLDDPIEKYLPEFKIRSPFPNSGPATIRQIMGHRAGFPMETPINCWESLEFPDGAALLSSLQDTELTCLPMTEYRYGNLGFAILGTLVSRVAKQPYRVYITEHILKPLGMRDATFERPSNGRVQAAHGYATLHGGPLYATPWPDTGSYESAIQLMTSAEDLGKFLSFQFRYGGPDGSDILKGSSLREMHWPTYIHPDWTRAQAVCWAIEKIGGETVHRHAGATFGFQATCSFVQRLQLGIVLLANLGSAQLDGIRREALELLMPELASRCKPPQKDSTHTIPSLKPFVGRYAHPAGISVEFAESGDKLLMLDSDAAGRLVGTLVPYGKNSFRVVQGIGAGERVNFFFDGGNTAQLVRFGSYAYYRV